MARRFFILGVSVKINLPYVDQIFINITPASFPFYINHIFINITVACLHIE